MPQKAVHNNYITIAKALAMIFVVVWHSRGFYDVGIFVMFFAVPLFFFTSGFFYKIPQDNEGLKQYLIKRVKGLYSPYLKWGLFFLLLHNVFFYLHLYDSQYGYEGNTSHIYSLRDFGACLVDLVFKMTTHEQMLGAFWFIRVLFIAAVFISVLTYLVNKVVPVNKWLLLAFLSILTFAASYLKLSIPLIGKVDLVFFASVFFLSGWIYRDYESKALGRWYVAVALLGLTCCGLIHYRQVIAIQTCPFADIIPYFILAMCGIFFTLSLSLLIEKTKARNVFYLVGNETLIILALHFLCFKLVSLIKIWHYGYPIRQLAEFPVIETSNSMYWIFYTLVGVSIPVCLQQVRKRLSASI
ncbi:MAG: acyltransferase family protein [Prevotella sp.]|nr:acyltransferase family protein [Prevotella sp.]